METMTFRARVGQDGVLHLEMPNKLWGQEVEAVIVLQPLPMLQSRMGQIC